MGNIWEMLSLHIISPLYNVQLQILPLYIYVQSQSKNIDVNKEYISQ